MEVGLASPSSYGYRIVIRKSQNPQERGTFIRSRRMSSRPWPLSCSLSFRNPEKFPLFHSAMKSLKSSFENLQTILLRQVKEFPLKKAENKVTEYSILVQKEVIRILPRQVKEFPWKQAEEKVTKYSLLLGKEVSGMLPKEVKDFPWKEAEEKAIMYSIFLAKAALRWSLAMFLILSPIWDVINAISRNMELTIPFGIALGVLVGEYLNQTSEEMFNTGNKEQDARMRLLGLGLIFVFLKLGLVFLKPPGQMLLSHVCNGGLVQVLWLLKKHERTSDKGTGENGEAPEPAL